MTASSTTCNDREQPETPPEVLLHRPNFSMRRYKAARVMPSAISRVRYVAATFLECRRHETLRSFSSRFSESLGTGVRCSARVRSRRRRARHHPRGSRHVRACARAPGRYRASAIAHECIESMALATALLRHAVFARTQPLRNARRAPADPRGARASGGSSIVDRVDTVEEILTELAVRDEFRERLVGRGNQPHIDRSTGRVAPNRSDLAALEHPQELRLQLGRQVADLVQEQGAAMRRLEAPGAIAVRVSECTFACARTARSRTEFSAIAPRSTVTSTRPARCRAPVQSRGRSIPCRCRSRRGSARSRPSARRARRSS